MQSVQSVWRFDILEARSVARLLTKESSETELFETERKKKEQDLTAQATDEGQPLSTMDYTR